MPSKVSATHRAGASVRAAHTNRQPTRGPLGRADASALTKGPETRASPQSEPQRASAPARSALCRGGLSYLVLLIPPHPSRAPTPHLKPTPPRHDGCLPPRPSPASSSGPAPTPQPLVSPRPGTSQRKRGAFEIWQGYFVFFYSRKSESKGREGGKMERSGSAHRPAAGSADASTRMQARAVLQVGSRRIDMLLGAACWCESDSCSARQQADAVLFVCRKFGQ